MPSLNLLTNIKDNSAKTPVLNMEFSTKGEMLAVSYDNARSSKEFEGRLEKEGSYITIFTNKSSYRSK